MKKFLLIVFVAYRYNYPGYVNRKALDKKSFPCNDARVRKLTHLYYLSLNCWSLFTPYVQVFIFVPMDSEVDSITHYSDLVVPLGEAIIELQDVSSLVSLHTDDHPRNEKAKKKMKK